MKSIAWIYNVDGGNEDHILYVVPITEENNGIVEKIRLVSNMVVNAEEYTDEQMEILQSLDVELMNSEFKSCFGELTNANISEIHLTTWAM